MFTIQSLPKSPFLSSEFPDTLAVDSQDDVFDVTVLCQSKQIFQTRIYAYNNKATLTNLREVIEDYMREHDIMSKTFSIVLSATDAPDQATTGNFTVIYCNYKLHARTTNFFDTHFLTIRTSFLVNYHETQELSWYQTETPEDEDVYTEFLVKTADGLKTYKVMDRADNRDMESEEFIPGQMFEDLIRDNDELKDAQPQDLLSITVHRGKRVMTFYITQATPNLSFQFRNCFNCIEYVHLFAATTLKTDVDRSEATCNGETQFYDQQTTKTNEVNITTLSLEHALWLNQLVESHQVKNAENMKPVLISDITSEISDETNSVNKLKFSWRYSDNSHTLETTSNNRIFTDPYTPQFN